jgi:hypothetical protein
VTEFFQRFCYRERRIIQLRNFYWAQYSLHPFTSMQNVAERGGEGMPSFTKATVIYCHKYSLCWGIISELLPCIEIGTRVNNHYHCICLSFALLFVSLYLSL